MKELRDWERHLLDPPPGSKAAEARDFGIDLTLTVGNLRLTAEERVRELDSFHESVKRLRVANLNLPR